MKKVVIIGLLLIFCRHAGAESAVDSSRSSVKGYLKFLHEVDRVREPDTLLTNQLIHQRFDGRWEIGNGFYAKGSLRTRLYYGQRTAAIPDFGKKLGSRQEYLKLDVLIIDEDEDVLFTESDRLYAGFQHANWDIRMGRQRINWGTNLVWNPNDIFNTYDILDFDYEERRGTDAIRLQYSPDDIYTFDLAIAPQPDSNSTYAGMIRNHVGTYDLQVLAGSINQHLVTGFGWAGNLGQAGCKGEVTWYARSLTQREQLSASGTIDYSPGSGWYTFGSFLYQSEVLTKKADASYLTGLSPTTSRYLMPFRWSFYLGGAKEINPIWSTQWAIIYGDSENTLILFPSITCSAAENLQLLVSSQIFFQDTDKMGWQAAMGYLRIRWDF